VNGGLTILVAAALFFVIAPIKAPGPPFMVIAVFHLLLAGFSLWRTRSAVMPIASGVFGLVFGVFLLFSASAFAHHGPLAVIAIYACAASDLLTGCSAIAGLFPVESCAVRTGSPHWWRSVATGCWR
jgi:hypothetical protein